MKLQELYKKQIVPKLKEKFQYKNNLSAPKLEKIVINIGFGRHTKEKDYIDKVENILVRISGQKPIKTKAKKSISAFKIRDGQIIGAAVTLRGQRMYDFFEKLINTTFPRVRDFRGIDKKSIDQQGNLTVGFKEHLAFPEIEAGEVENIFGLEVCMHTSARNKDEGLELFSLLGFPFKKD